MRFYRKSSTANIFGSCVHVYTFIYDIEAEFDVNNGALEAREIFFQRYVRGNLNLFFLKEKNLNRISIIDKNTKKHQEGLASMSRKGCYNQNLNQILIQCNNDHLNFCFIARSCQ